MAKNILLLNGPNLNMLGKRDPVLYGDITLKKVEAACEELAEKHGMKLNSEQTNYEGKEEQKAFLNYGVQFFRDAFLINYSLHKLVHYQTENDFDIEKIAPFITSNNIQDLISLFEISHYQILRNANAKMVFDNLV